MTNDKNQSQEKSIWETPNKKQNSLDNLKPLEVIVKYCPSCTKLDCFQYLKGSEEAGLIQYTCEGCGTTRSYNSILSYDARRRTQNLRKWK